MIFRYLILIVGLAATGIAQHWYAAARVQPSGNGLFVLAEDLDGDGDVDAIRVAAPQGSPVSFTPALNNGAGEFMDGIPVALPAGTSAVTLRLGDVTGDGILDLVAAVWS